jgi:hypothetical protein
MPAAFKGYPYLMSKLVLTPLLLMGLLFLPSCSSSDCKDFETTLKRLDAEFVAANKIAQTRVQNSETWVPVIKKGLDMTNFALNDSTCMYGEARAQWQTIHQDLTLRLESWIR